LQTCSKPMLTSLWTATTTAVSRAPPPPPISVQPLTPSRKITFEQNTPSEEDSASEKEDAAPPTRTKGTIRQIATCGRENGHEDVQGGLMDDIADLVAEPTALTTKGGPPNLLSRSFEEHMVRQLSQATPPSLPTPPSTSLRSPAVEPQQPPGGAPPGRPPARVITIPVGRACAFCPRLLSSDTGRNWMWLFPQCDDVSQHDLCSLYTNTT